MIIYELRYDRDWGQRHPRRPELTWLFDKRLVVADTERFLRSEGCPNMNAFTWERLKLHTRVEIKTFFSVQDKNLKAISAREYGSTSRAGPILR